MVASLASSAKAEVASDDQVAAGRKFSERVCGACHVVTGQRDEVPPFGATRAELRRTGAAARVDGAVAAGISDRGGEERPAVHRAMSGD
jgi:mono/diheme cytochrome c family protein